ncbi:MAG: HAD hydrolase-like protein, partial [Clostridia bacterium]|nr:HAD hydrolase-like protein [Clostridia bacterium]
KGTSAMVNNDGSKSNKKAFWEIFSKYYPENTSDSEKYFTDFYNTDFQKARDFCGFNPKANIAVNTAKNMGYKTILATNPIFPALATESRIYWAGLNPSSFEFYTSYENMGFSKPNIKYYTEIANRIGLLPEECLMVGNDVDEDMIAESIGMKVFLLTDCLVNTNNKDISLYENGDFDKLIEYIKTMNNH